VVSGAGCGMQGAGNKMQGAWSAEDPCASVGSVRGIRNLIYVLLP